MIILTHCTFCWLFFPVPSPKVRLASLSSWNNWNNLRTSFPAILPPGTSVHTATTIIIYFLKFRSHHVTPLLKAQMLLLFASWLTVTIVYLHLVLFFTLLSTWILASACQFPKMPAGLTFSFSFSSKYFVILLFITSLIQGYLDPCHLVSKYWEFSRDPSVLLLLMIC